ncbi:hypothetical protein AB0M79_30940 [Polymorphospora sp. NPDC051019]|uniref:hypothetical protein n=1 Tax=Polymorphospora sp. NPDC051019 TaxID=3155725 RepID=UPI00342284F7
MVETREPAAEPAEPAEVAQCLGGRWAVEVGRWSDRLPPGCADLLAPPVVVSVLAATGAPQAAVPAAVAVPAAAAVPVPVRRAAPTRRRRMAVVGSGTPRDNPVRPAVRRPARAA